MTIRPAGETLASLRLTLQNLEKTQGPNAGAEELAALKRILLQRIADLELDESRASDKPSADTAAQS